MHVQLTGSGGQKLQIASGHTAQITMTIDASQMATAPASIPLWHFDEANGYWKEEGNATKEGNKYVGTVSHFSWWNCDAQFPTVILNVNVVDHGSHPLSNVRVDLTFNGYTRSGISNNGTVSGLIPANQVMTMNIYSQAVCGGAIGTFLYSEMIGPFAADTTLPNVAVESQNILSSVIQGNLKKCSGANVINGYVVISFANSWQIVPVENGIFSFQTLYCNSNTSFSLKGVDMEALQETSLGNYNLTPTVTNIGNISACGTIDEYITYQIDSNPAVTIVSGVGAMLDGNGLNIYDADYIELDAGFSIVGHATVPGIYTTNVFTLRSAIDGLYIGSLSTNSVNFHLISFGAIQEYIDMTFSGSYTEFQGTASHIIQGTVHVRRQY